MTCRLRRVFRRPEIISGEITENLNLFDLISLDRDKRVYFKASDLCLVNTSYIALTTSTKKIVESRISLAGVSSGSAYLAGNPRGT